MKNIKKGEQEYCATFSSENITYDNENFEGLFYKANTDY